VPEQIELSDLDRLLQRLQQAVRAGDRRPLDLLAPEDDEVIIRAFVTEPLLARRFESQFTQACQDALIRPASQYKLTLHRNEAKRRIDQANAAQGLLDAGQRANTQRRQRELEEETWSPENMVDSGTPHMIAAGHILYRRPGRLWFDSFYGTIRLDWNGDEDRTPIEPAFLDDARELNICMWLRRRDIRLAKVGDRVLLSAIRFAAHRIQKNEPQDWLNSLEWDGVERLYSMMPRIFTTTDDDYHRQVGRCAFVSMVARIMTPGCKVDTMPVLLSDEGTRKAQALEIIGGKGYGVAISKIGSHDFLQEQWGKTVFEIPELHSMLGGRSEKSKAVMSTGVDNFRAPYDRVPAPHPRTCVWWGSSNIRKFLDEPTGGRRLWPCVLQGSIDLDLLRSWREQLWAEAVAYWRRGTGTMEGCWWNVPEEEQRAQVDAARETGPFDHRIEAWLAATELYDGVSDVPAIAANARTTGDKDPLTGQGAIEVSWGTLVTVDRIASTVLGMTPEMLARGSNTHKIGYALRRLGWQDERRRIEGGGRVSFWARSTRLDPITPATFVGNNEIPF
jgi:Virulence-associated protein E